MLTKQKLPPRVLKEILSKFDLGKIKKIKPLPTSGNVAYAIKSDKDKYLLRLCPTGQRWRSKEEIAAELELIGYLLKNKFPVPKPILAKNGERIIKWKNHFGYIRKFIDGEPKLNPTLKEVEKFGELVGWFHSLTQNYKTKNKRRHIWDLQETKKTFQQTKKMILKSKFAKKKEFVRKLEQEFSSLNFPNNLQSGMIHEDLGKRHILWRKDKIIGVIDFDRCYYGKLIFDLGEACRGWCFINNWRNWSNKNFEALIGGYERRRKLTKIEKQYLIDSIKFAILEKALSFCLRYIEVTHDRRDEKYALHSISEKGLLGMVGKNKEKIRKIIAV